MDLRRVVGHRTLIQAAASIICVDKEGRLLLGRRTDNHMWGYSGGAVEIDEKIEDCARRELYEEMGITAGELELFYINSGPEAHYVYPNGDEVSNVDIVFLCKEYSGSLICQESEVEELRFLLRRIYLKTSPLPFASLCFNGLPKNVNKNACPLV